MPPKNNPLKLNKLQLKTLALLQELARSPESSTVNPETGDVTISTFPNLHGNHFHLGDAIVRSQDASGLRNEAVWRALERKGLAIASYPMAIKLTPNGQAYEVTGVDTIFLHSDH